MQRLGEKVRMLRTPRDDDQKLGVGVRVSLSQLRERNRNGKKQPSTELIIKLADLFQVTVDQLVRDECDV